MNSPVAEQPSFGRSAAVVSVSRLGLVLTTIVAVALMLCQTSIAAPQEENDDSDGLDRSDLVQRLPMDRKTSAALELLRLSIARNDNATALREFQRLRTADSHLMVPGESDTSPFLPLYRAMFREFLRLPAELREQFRATQDAVAGQEFRRAVEQGQLSELVGLIHQYPGTLASQQACLLIAFQHRDRGESLAAQVWARELDRDGIDPKLRAAAQVMLSEIDTSMAKAEPELSPDPLPSEAPQPAQRDVPQFLQWQYRTSLSRPLQETVGDFLVTCAQAKIVPQTTWTADIDDGRIFRRTMHGVAAIDSVTGKPSWHYPVATNHETLLQEQRATRTIYNPRLATTDEASARSRFAELEKTPLIDLFCRDGVQCRLTMDRERIYLVAEGTEAAAPASTRRFFPRDGSRGVYRGSELIALEKDSGRRVWTAGGQLEDRYQTSPLDTAWFAGPPTVDRGRLYGITERADEISLTCLVAATGEHLWSVPLAYPEQSIDNDPARRLWSASVAVDDGLIWCPTTTGWLIAVDRLTRSTVWACQLESPVRDGGPPIPVPRGRQFIRTERESLTSAWPPLPVFPAGGHLIVFPRESHDIRFFDPVTGELKHRIDANSSSLLLHLDSGNLVIGTGQSITNFDPATARPIWERLNTDVESLPSGSGILQGQQLLVPMVNGSISIINLADGTLADSLRVPLPNPGWGHLVAIGSDLLCVAPDRMLRLSAHELNPDLRDPLELATALSASGNWAEALRILEQIQDTDQRNPQVHRITFECRYRLAVSDPEHFLDTLQATATSPEEVLQVNVLKTRQLLRNGQSEEAAASLLNILTLEPSLLLSEDYVPAETKSATSEPSVATPGLSQHLPLTTWATGHLSDLVKRATPDQSAQLAAKLRQLPDHLLLQVASAAATGRRTGESSTSDDTAETSDGLGRVAGIRSLLHERMHNASSGETTLNMLIHSLALAGQPDPDASTSDADDLLEAPLRAFRKLVSDNHARLRQDPATDESATEDSTTWLAARSLLLNCVAVELAERWHRPLSDFDPAADSPVEHNDVASRLLTRDELSQRFRQAVRDQWNQWPDRRYEMLPFAQPSGINGPASDISPGSADDPFLRHYEWSVLAEPSRLRATVVADPDRANWIVPASLGVHSWYTSAVESIQRCGSVLLVQTNTGITAISVLDQRVLWSRSHNRQSRILVTVGPAEHQFTDFDISQRQQPGTQSMGVLTVIPAGSRHVCLRFGNELEVVNLLTGQSLWSLACDRPFQQAVATERLLFLTSAVHRDGWCFRLADGAAVASELSAETLVRTMAAAGDSLVVWRTKTDSKNGPLVEWIDPETQHVNRSLSLSESQQFHFVDDNTLVGMSDNQSMQVINLQTGDRNSASFAPTDQQAASDDEDDADPSPKLWTADRMFVVADPLTWYVTNSPTGNVRRLRQPFDQRGESFAGGIRAVDRQSGTVRWVVDENTSGVVATDQPGLPVIVIVHNEDTPGPLPQRQFSGTGFRGIRKMSGSRLFDGVIPTRFNIAAAWVSTDRHHALNIEVYGNQVRLEPKGTSSIKTPDVKGQPGDTD
ncbi:MAG: PQQ-binding-like beta-propeller repeat protein [Planctomycetaceae bacterium]